ncbi:hypothetical protein NPIL_496731 [Nephila pilipes]|uniref:Uncharacterized protein n=1 Tax=Nephila pilipes TaxID=299642 RepID=A0A8X6PWU6_NEPPI|nr:hypothetical protein NPIL_496731 [Nephila pilipes]
MTISNPIEQKIAEEINAKKIFSIEIDATQDIYEEVQCSVTVCYIKDNEEHLPKIYFSVGFLPFVADLHSTVMKRTKYLSVALPRHNLSLLIAWRESPSQILILVH